MSKHIVEYKQTDNKATNYGSAKVKSQSKSVLTFFSLKCHDNKKTLMPKRNTYFSYGIKIILTCFQLELCQAGLRHLVEGTHLS